MGKILGIVAIAAVAIVGIAVVRKFTTSQEELESGLTPTVAE